MNSLYSFSFQGVWVGLMTTFGSLARVIGPIIVTTTYTSVGTYLALGIVAGSMVVTLLMNLSVYDRMVPLNLSQNVIVEEEEDNSTIHSSVD